MRSTMYSDLQSRGIKRKFGERNDSEDLAVEQLRRSDGSVRVNPALVKLQNSCCNGNSKSKTNAKTITSHILHHHLNIQNCYVRQRQHLFNLSMCKLNRYRQSADPSLSRSVLICNTLRTLEKEFEREGIKINLGPTGVSYIPSVLSTQSMTQVLDPPPSASQSINNQNHNTLNHNHNTNTNNTEPSSYLQVSSIGENENDSTNGEYKRLLDLDSFSGRVTPFHKPLSSNSSVYDRENDSSVELSVNGINSLTQSTTSAFWNSDDASDRLTSLNWSSVLNFNSSNVTTNANKTLLYSTNGQNDNNDTNDTTESGISSDTNATTTSGSTITTSCRPSTSFTTLLPPSTSTSSASVTTTSTNTTSPVKSSSISPNIITQNLLNSQHSNHISLTNGSNSVSYSNSATNDEIFGDIDLSLYDFDLLSPLSPPNVKLAPITAEELIRTISPTDSNSSGISSTSTSSLTSSSSSYSSNASSSQLSSSLSSSSSSSSSPSSVLSSVLTATSSSSTLMSTSSGYHGRYFKSSDELFNDDRDQKAITPVMS